MPKKRKSAALADRAMNLISCQAEQPMDGVPASSAAPPLRMPGMPSVNGKLVKVQFRTNGRRGAHLMPPLEELVAAAQTETGNGQTPASPRVEPPDRSFSFAQAARARIRGALLRCEERYPIDSHQPVLYVVVKESAVRWKHELQVLHRQYFQNGDAFPMEVIEQSADDLLRRLVSAGLLAETVRITRPLWPPDAATFFSPLSDDERRRAAMHRRQAARKLKMASVLDAGDLAEEARMALLEAIEPLGRALAVENRLPEPGSLEDALLPPLEVAWKDAPRLLRAFLRETSHPVAPLIACLERI